MVPHDTLTAMSHDIIVQPWIHSAHRTCFLWIVLRSFLLNWFQHRYTQTRRVTGSHEAEVWVFWCQHGWLRQICLAWIVSLCKLRLATWSKGVNTLTPQRHEVCSSKSSKTVTRVLEIDFEWRKLTSVRSVMFSHTGAFSRRRMNVRSRRFLAVMTGGTEHHWSPQMGLQGAQAAQVHGISYFEAPPDEAIQK